MKSGSRIKVFSDRVRSRRAAVAITVGLAAPVLLGFAGLVVDAGYWYGSRTALQVAADAGAMAAARVLPYSAAQNSAYLQQVASDAANQASSSLKYGPLTVTAALNGGSSANASVTVEVQQAAPGFFSEIVDYTTGSVAAFAVAGMANPVSACILALSQTASAGIDAYGNGKINSSTCGLYSNSASSTAVSISSNSSVTAPLVGAVGSVSGTTTNANATVIDGGNALPNPYGGLAEPLTGNCTYTDLTVGSGSTTLQPGTYCGGLTIGSNADVTFGAGFYAILNGNFSMAGTATVQNQPGGVTFDLGGSNPGEIDWLGNTTSGQTLAAPTSGPYANILIFQNPDATPAGTGNLISGNSAISVSGTMYFPHDSLTVSGNGTTGPVLQIGQSGSGINIVAQTVTVSGNGTINTGAPVNSGASAGGTPILTN